MIIKTFAAFYARMEEVNNPKPGMRPRLRDACDMIYHHGIQSATAISERCGVSRPTATKWVGAARTLGIKKGERRVSETKVTQNELKQPSVSTENIAPPRKLDISTEDMRENLKALHYSDAISAPSPEARSRATEALTKITPDLKAPEVSVNLQAFIGNGAAEHLIQRVTQSIGVLVDKDPDWLRTILVDGGAEKLLLERHPDAVEAEIVDATDDSDESGTSE